MITNIANPPAVSVKPPAITEAAGGYFDAYCTRPTPASLQRDLRPMSALDQMFAYYEA